MIWILVLMVALLEVVMIWIKQLLLASLVPFAVLMIAVLMLVSLQKSCVALTHVSDDDDEELLLASCQAVNRQPNTPSKTPHNFKLLKTSSPDHTAKMKVKTDPVDAKTVDDVMLVYASDALYDQLAKNQIGAICNAVMTCCRVVHGNETVLLLLVGSPSAAAVSAVVIESKPR